MAPLMAVGRSAPGGLVLRGRRDECAVLGGLLEAARQGRSGVLVVRGEAGVGETALVEDAIAAGGGMRGVRAGGGGAEAGPGVARPPPPCAPGVGGPGGPPAPQR